MLRLFCCENWQIILPNVVSWRVTVVVDVHILGLPSVGHPADTSAAVEDWCSNVVLVELMDDGHTRSLQHTFPRWGSLKGRRLSTAGE